MEMDEWLEVDENLALWEGDDGVKLSASDRRILLANWYFNATTRKRSRGTPSGPTFNMLAV